MRPLYGHFTATLRSLCGHSAADPTISAAGLVPKSLRYRAPTSQKKSKKKQQKKTKEERKKKKKKIPAPTKNGRRRPARGHRTRRRDSVRFFGFFCFFVCLFFSFLSLSLSLSLSLLPEGLSRFLSKFSRSLTRPFSFVVVRLFFLFVVSPVFYFSTFFCFVISPNRLVGQRVYPVQVLPGHHQGHLTAHGTNSGRIETRETSKSTPNQKKKTTKKSSESRKSTLFFSFSWPLCSRK